MGRTRADEWPWSVATDNVDSGRESGNYCHCRVEGRREPNEIPPQRQVVFLVASGLQS